MIKLHKLPRSIIVNILLISIFTQTDIYGAVTSGQPVMTAKKVRLTALQHTPRATEIKKAKARSFFLNPAHEKKVGPKLAKALRQSISEGEAKALQSLQASQTKLSEDDDKVVVLIRRSPGSKLKSVEASIKSAGARILRSNNETLKVSLPLSAIESIASLAEVNQIRTLLPPRKKAVVTSEGVAATGAATWHGYGFKGAGAKVAVVDTGYKNLSTYRSANEIPANAIEVNFSAESNMSNTDVHGIACAEIIHDMAPNAQLYLIKIDDINDLILVKDYCISEGIDIISCSMGWDILNFHDGIAYDNWYTYPEHHPVTAVNLADAAGILCVFAAGNEQEQQSVINWGASDEYLLWDNGSDLNRLYDIDGSTAIPAGRRLIIDVTWNEWPLTANDFDIYLYKKTGSKWNFINNFHAWSKETQDGSETSYPMESIDYTTTSSGEYALSIDKKNASSSPTFLVRYYGIAYPHYWSFGNITDPVPGSISIPGDAAACFTVGALDYSTYTSGPIAYYSSLGPNNRAYTGGIAVPKPDICAPTEISTKAYGASFGGTSSSTPHIAGLAALIKGVYPAYSSAELKQYIKENGFDLGPAGVDNTYGSGAALLPAQLAATVTLSNLKQDYDGTPKSVAATTIPNGLNVDFTYAGSAVAPTVLGSYPIVGTINETPFYGSTTGILTITIDPELEGEALEISVLTTAIGGTTLNFSGIPGGTYNLMTRSSLTTGSWQPIGSVTLDSNGTATFFDNTPPTGSRFYLLQK